MEHWKKINHLYWRAGFGVHPLKMHVYQNSIQENVNLLFADAKRQESELSFARDIFNMSSQNKEDRRKKSIQSVQKIKNDWLIRMTKPEYSALLERMCLFWHGHFACRIVLGGKLATQYLSTLRKNALGSFRALLHDIAKDPAMIRYLNNQQNRKGQPNENFARELMELFSMGRGNYTEKDIKESARAFTGWSSNVLGDYVFRKRQHDFGVKEFRGHRGNFNGDDIIDIILDDKQTAHYIAEKVYSYFVNEQIDTDRVRMLGNLFYSSDYNIELLMRAIFESDWFYMNDNIGSKIKSPIEYIVGLIRHLNIDIGNPLVLVGLQRQLGQILLNPPNVAGWPGGRSWIDNATLLSRLNLPSFAFVSSGLINAKQTDLSQRFKKLKIRVDYKSMYGAIKESSKAEILNSLTSFLILTNKPDSSLINFGIRFKKKDEYFDQVLMRILSTPEYQMC